ncbi:dipeptidase [Thalassotalea crassostreae]|uniref:dipeptidase n=1 Tax=Thalassotalea crassostreae TaxID=1763536 RepID=UPI000838B5A3|nr:membrane dipeptidase [Thalassotalea crassostreae]
MNINKTVLASTLTTLLFACSANSETVNNEPSAMGPAPTIEMRDRPTDKQEFDSYVEYLIEVANPRTEQQQKEDDYIKARYKDTMVVDSLWVGAPNFPAGFGTEMYEESTQHSIDNKFNVISATVTNAGKPDTTEVVRERMIATNKHWQENSDKYLQVKSIEDFDRAKAEGKLGIFHNFQGMMPLSQEGDAKEAVKNLNEFYDLGLRQLMYSYNVDTPYSDGGVSNSDGTDTGVQEAGFAVLKEANRLGIAIDCSHSSNKTCIDAAIASTKPIMASHSNPTAIRGIDRSISDEAIKAIAAGGGLICINFIGGFLNEQGDATPFSIAKHAEYIRNLTGPEHVCAGSDYVWNYGDTLHWILNNPKDFPIEMGYATPSHMGKPSEMWGAARVLEEVYGWTKEEVSGFLGENLKRFYGQVWAK